MSSSTLNLILVEDDRELRESLADALGREDGLVVGGAFASAEAAVAHADWGGADILLSDLELPGMSGVELIRWVRTTHDDVISAVHTIHDDRDLVFRSIEAGAVGYVMKGADAGEIATQLRGLREGLAPVSPAIAMMLLRALGPEADAGQTEPLSTREVELLRLVAAGYRYKEVAATLGISTNTVQSHIRRIYIKLQADDRRGLIRRARVLGLI